MRKCFFSKFIFIFSVLFQFYSLNISAENAKPPSANANDIQNNIEQLKSQAELYKKHLSELRARISRTEKTLVEFMAAQGVSSSNNYQSPGYYTQIFLKTYEETELTRMKLLANSYYYAKNKRNMSDEELDSYIEKTARKIILSRYSPVFKSLDIQYRIALINYKNILLMLNTSNDIPLLDESELFPIGIQPKVDFLHDSDSLTTEELLDTEK